MDLELGIIIGLLQGLVEWIPVSSQGQLVLALTQLTSISLSAAISLALFAHIGTAFVVLIYYRKDFITMVSDLKKYLINRKKEVTIDNIAFEGVLLTKIVILTTIATLPTALLSLIVFEEVFMQLDSLLPFLGAAEIITLLIGLSLIMTGIILRSRPSNKGSQHTLDNFNQITWKHAVLLGLIQGFAAIPGISRSGVTITYLLLGPKLDSHQSLRGSFLISVPVTFGAGILEVVRGKLSFVSGGVAVENEVLLSYLGVFFMIASAFVVGIITLKAFLELAKRLDFSNFLFAFGVIAIAAILIGLFL